MRFPLSFKEPFTQDEYLQLAENMGRLLEAEYDMTLKSLEAGEIHIAVLKLPALISTVNFIGYLRGQDGMFSEDMPSEVSTKIRKIEEAWEQHLTELIEKTCMLPGGTVNLRKRLSDYFIEARLPHKLFERLANDAVERYTLSLREIQIEPAITEDKTFEDPNREVIQKTAFEYIEQKYPDRYKNKTTLDRLIAASIRDNSGMTLSERTRAIFEEAYPDKAVLERSSKESEADDEITKKYALLYDEVEEWYRKEGDRIVAETEDVKEREPLFDKLAAERAEKIAKLADDESAEKNRAWGF